MVRVEPCWWIHVILTGISMTWSISFYLSEGRVTVDTPICSMQYTPSAAQHSRSKMTTYQNLYKTVLTKTGYINFHFNWQLSVYYTFHCAITCPYCEKLRYSLIQMICPYFSLCSVHGTLCRYNESCWRSGLNAMHVSPINYEFEYTDMTWYDITDSDIIVLSIHLLRSYFSVS